MKNLHATKEEKWRFTSFAELSGVVRRVESPAEVILLLHGLGERGKRIYRKLINCLPETALVIAPDAPFPISRNRPEKMDFGHSWYFYDKREQKYYITQDLAKFWLRDLLKIENPTHLPVTIIGFSQGGYLAPLAGHEIKETRLVIGLGCEFRSTLIHAAPPFPMIGVHGEKDTIITMDSALSEIAKLKELGIEIEFHKVKDAAHEITSEMAKTVKTILETHGTRTL